jgi:hypothetical protein
VRFDVSMFSFLSQADLQRRELECILIAGKDLGATTKSITSESHQSLLSSDASMTHMIQISYAPEPAITLRIMCTAPSTREFLTSHNSKVLFDLKGK